MSAAKLARLRLRKQAKEFHRPKPVLICNSFDELKKRYEAAVHPDTRAFLEGSFIWELGNHRTRELLETPEHMAERLTEIDILEAT